MVERPVVAEPARPSSRLVTRRRLLAGGGAVLGAGALEYASLRGAFDHRRFPGEAGRARYLESLDALASDGELAAGAIVHVGHSTHLLSVGAVRMLTDPWFYDPSFGALAHVRGPAVTPEAIGALDVVLITHDHADHADARALDRLDKRAIAIVATNELASRARALGFAAVEVLAPWASLVHRGVTISAVPGKHDIYEIGYVIVGAGRAVYFAGDTRLHEDLPAIGERFAPTFAILPVDGTRLTGGALHVMTPDDAVVAARTLGVVAVMPSHAEAVFSDPLVKYAIASTIEGAPALFADAVRRLLPTVRCAVPLPGEVVRLPRG